MHDKKYQREDQKDVDEKSGDVKRDERQDPNEDEQDCQTKERESHAGTSGYHPIKSITPVAESLSREPGDQRRIL
jgi:hypothetical protein